ncbi:MAG TPA: gamma-glutamyl-gamma-aminobutyrate hydrolase family protein [Marmoricola sp.]|nr:gamma-glutamyl-gamma-aminobutyrate hydrolase family protein [Marmoricola sp.]
MSTTTPVIGITTYREQARWGVWDEPADVLHAAYARTLEAVGAAVVLLPPGPPATAPAVLSRVDGLVVSGGADVDPIRYGEQPGPHTTAVRPDRDAWELALLDEAARRDLPTLMVCRGMQLEAARIGGRLDQHTPDVVGDERHSPGGDAYGEVRVTTVPGTMVAALIGPEQQVRCHHHQSVREHPGLVASAHAEDGTVEAVEHPGRRFWIGVQWHPETLADIGLFQALVAAARLSA